MSTRLPATILLTLAAAFALPAAATEPAAAATPAHHTASGFRNRFIEQVDKPLSMLLRWRWEALRDGLPRPPQEPVASVAPALGQLARYQQPTLQPVAAPAPAHPPSVTWIGHATTLVQAGGLNVLTDPIFSERASPLPFAGPKRAQPPGIALGDLPAIDVVVISHSHYDHLDRISVIDLDARSGGRTLFLVPLGLKAWMEHAGIRRVVELDWWQSHRVGRVEFTLTPVQHWSARTPFDRNETLWGGWAVLAPDLHWYFAGDTGYSADFADTRARFAPRQGTQGFDLALIPVGAYEPRWFMKEQHVDPEEAVRIHQDLGARRSLGIHWGTFSLTDEALDQPPRDLARAREAHGVPEDDFFLLRIGETRWLPPRQAPVAMPASGRP
jgi:N-acyl-phosphatidylethanolamine-hydrolysing phospholipase D